MAHTAAALAATSVVFSSEDSIYAGQLFDAAQSLYLLAAANEGLYSDNFAPDSQVSIATGCTRSLKLEQVVHVMAALAALSMACRVY